MGFYVISTTTREQSERLINMGLKIETADCLIDEKGKTYFLPPGTDVLKTMEEKKGYPSWTLDKLCYIFPKEISLNTEELNNLNEEAARRRISVHFKKHGRNVQVFGQAEGCVFLFEKFKELGYIDKEYLNENQQLCE